VTESSLGMATDVMSIAAVANTASLRLPSTGTSRVWVGRRNVGPHPLLRSIPFHPDPRRQDLPSVLPLMG
jgi:hypothetical protein